MHTRRLSRRLLALAAALATLTAAFLLLVRPACRDWGATQAEQVAALPGDRWVLAGQQSTRAISIDAPASRVWAWLSQMGQDRGGFYSYELLEDLVGCEIENLDVIRPELGRWEIGEKLWMYPPHKLDGMGHATLAELEPGNALVFLTRRAGTSPADPPDGTWAFIVQDRGSDASRLLIRSRGTPPGSILAGAFERFVFEPIHFVMERKMMTTLKTLSEGGGLTPGADTVQVLAWTAALVLLVLAGVQLLRRARSLRPLIVFLAAAGVFQVVTLVQPHFLVSSMLVLLLAFGLRWTRGRPATSESRATARRQGPDSSQNAAEARQP